MSAFTYEIICSIDYNDKRKHSRSVITPLKVYQSDNYLNMSSNDEQYAYVVIKDANRNIEKSETVVVASGQDTLLYIGDLASGTYELTIETDSYTLYGCFEVE